MKPTSLTSWRPIAIALGALALVAGSMIALHAAAGDPTPPTVAQAPLYLTNRIKPNFIMAVDDSGSMDFETLLPGNDGAAWWSVSLKSFSGKNRSDAVTNGTEVLNFNAVGASDNNEWKKYAYLFPMGTGVDGKELADSTNDHFAVPPTADFGWLRSPDYNAAYFDPTTDYPPWRNFDDTPFPAITVTNAQADPMRGTRRIDLTAVQSTSGSESEFMFMKGMKIPFGTEYKVSTCYNGGTNPTNTTLDVVTTSSFRLAAADRVVGGTTDGRARCSIAIRYYPATFYVLSSRASAVATALNYKTTAMTTGFVSPGDASGNNRQNLTRFEIKSANFNTPASYTTAIDNFARWFTYYRKRHLAARAGLSQAFASLDNSFIKTGYFTINNTAAVTMRDMAIASDRQAFYNQFLALNPGGGTPNKDAVDWLGQQFQRTNTGKPITLACEKNFGMLFTDGFSDPTGPTVGNLDGAMGAPFADAQSNTMADIATKYYTTNLRPDLTVGKVPVPNQCTGSNPDVRLDCVRNPHMNLYGVTLGSRGVVFDPDANPPQDPFASTPAWPTSFAARSPTAVDDLWHATINSRGRFLNANTPKDIADSIKEILVAVSDAIVPTERDATSSARITADTFFLIPSFATRNNGRDWSGSLVAYDVTDSGTLGNLIWSTGGLDPGDAADRIPDPSARTVIVTTTAGTSSTRVASTFTTSALGSTTAAQFAALGVSTADQTLLPGVTPSDAVDYLKGVKTKEVTISASGAKVGVLRPRFSRLGDLVNSTPTIFTAKENFGYSSLPGTAGTAYTTYLATTARKTRPTMIYVGANDGMLHAFKASDGVEAFGYIPKSAVGNLGALLMPQYQHRYYVDGQNVVTDAWNGTAWKTILVGAVGAGGQSIYGLDVTASNTLTPSNVMWELNGANNADVGHILGKPLVVPVRGTSGPRWAVITGNGYNSTNGRPALLVIDAFTGAVITTLRPSFAGATSANGLGNVVAIPDADGYAATVYSGDLAGNVWKFNLSGSTVSSWGVALAGAPLFTATDPISSTPQPITGGFEVARGPQNSTLLFFGTGRYFAVGDNVVDTNTKVETLYAVRDAGAAVGGPSALQQRTITESGTGDSRVRQVDNTGVDYATKKGWYVNLRIGTATGSIKGEKFLAQPRVEGGLVFFPSFEPIGDSCTPGGVNWLYGFDVLTGSGALNNVSIDGAAGTLCVGGCAGVGAGTGGPVTETLITVPKPVCIPGSSVDCQAPIPCEVGQTSGCTPPELLPGQDALRQGCIKVVSVGGKQIVQPRACGRQSWRQVE